MAKFGSFKIALLAGASLAAACGASPALAQDGAGRLPAEAPAGTVPATQTSDSAEVNPAAGGDIVVTATRRAQRLQDVPISMIAVQPAELANRHIDNPSQLPLVAPSLQVQSNNGSPAATFFSIRGIGTLSFVNFINSSVSLVIDDVAMFRPAMGVVSFSDISQVEVLNGPQGMLFGKNASAGLVNISTNQPVIGSFSGRASAEYGSMTTPGKGSEYLVQGTLNVPVTANSALRINGAYTAYDPLVRNVFNPAGSDFGYEQKSVKAKYLWEPSSALRITVAGDYASASGIGPGATTDRSVVAGSPFAALDAAVGITPGPENAKLSSDQVTNANFKVGGVQARIEYELGNGDTITDVLAWRSYHAYSIFDNDQHQVNILNELSGTLDINQLSNELRLTSASGRKVDYQVGLYYLRGRVKQDVTALGNLGLGAPPAPFSSYIANFVTDTEHERSYAVFGQSTYHVTDALSLTAGGRLTYDDLDNKGNSIALNGPVQLVPVGVIPRTTTSHTDFSWRVSGQYDFSRDVMAYATVSRGYKGPGFNQFSALAVPPETSYNYEGGIKTQLLDRRLTINVSGFVEHFKNFQAQTFDPALYAYSVRSAGSLDSKGFELQIEARPVQGLSLGANIAYVDATFGSFVGDQCYAGQSTGTDPNRSNVCVNGVSNSTGNPLTNAPRLTTVMTAQYSKPIGNGYNLSVSGAYYRRSSVFFASNSDPATRLGGYGLLDANLSFGALSESWKIGVFCRNCGDRRFATNILANPLVATDYGQQFAPNSFRTLGVVLSSKF